ncbi:hypothetical protein [Mycobacterium sp. URHB0021]
MTAPDPFPIAAEITRYRMQHPLRFGGQGMSAEAAWEYADHVADQVIALEKQVAEQFSALVRELTGGI